MAATTELLIVFCDCVVEMAHTHACLQEEKEDASIEETIASLCDCEDDLREIVSAIVANRKYDTASISPG